MYAWQATVQDEAGNVVPLPVVTVYVSGTESLADIYDSEGDALNNPLTGTIEGFVKFYAASGAYDIVGASGSNSTEVWSVNLGQIGFYQSRSEAEMSVVGGDVDVIHAGGLMYDRDANGSALTTADGAKWSPKPSATDGFISLAHWGVTYGDRGAAQSNGEKINEALEWCAENKAGLNLGSGTIFNSVPVVQTGAVNVKGSGVVGEWSKWTTSAQGRADTTIVMVGEGPKDRVVYGVSSGHNWGAGRVNPSARDATHNEREYRLLSFVESNESAAPEDRKLLRFSAAWYMNRGASGSSISGFRIVPDYGGDDGMHGYTDTTANTVGVTSYPLSQGVWDVGIMADNTIEVMFDRLQSVGQWRMAGLLAISHARNNPAGLYKNTFQDCSFGGYHGVEIRGADGAPVVSFTTDSVTVPWADDHPFGADGDMEFIVSSGPGVWPNQSVIHTFTGMVKDVSGEYPALRLTGVTPALSGTVGSISLPYQGGGTSHTHFHRGEVTSFQHPSRQPCQTKGLAGVAEGVFNFPGCCVGISGSRATEVEFRATSITSIEEVAVHIHDCRNFSYDGYVEMNRAASGMSSRGGRVIMSPPPASNPHSLTGKASAGTLFPTWVHRGSTLYDGTLDTRPAQPLATQAFAWDAPGDNGFMTPAHLRMPLDPCLNSHVGEGGAMIAPSGGRAGFGRRAVVTPFQTESPDDIDWAMYYNIPTNNVRVRKDLVTVNQGQAAIGVSGNGFSQVYADRFISRLVTIANNSVASIPMTGGRLIWVGHSPSSNTPQWAFSGMVYVDTGTSLWATKVSGGNNLDVITSTPDGNTGEDGKVTVGVGTGEIVIENRSGNQYQFAVSIIG